MTDVLKVDSEDMQFIYEGMAKVTLETCDPDRDTHTQKKKKKKKKKNQALLIRCGEKKMVIKPCEMKSV